VRSKKEDKAMARQLEEKMWGVWRGKGIGLGSRVSAAGRMAREVSRIDTVEILGSVVGEICFC
jgi:hypothetical protein